MSKNSQSTGSRAAFAVALLALFLALTSSAWAPEPARLTSNSVGSEQIKNDSETSRDIANKTISARDIKGKSITGRAIKNGSLTDDDFKKGEALRELLGPPGPPGTPGAPGPPGTTEAITHTEPFSILTTGREVVGVTLPAGNWFVISHLGGAHRPGSAQTRLECTLVAPDNSAADFSKIRLAANTGDDALVFADLTLHGIVSVTGSGTARTACVNTSAGDPGIDLTNAKISAVRVGTVTGQ